MLIAGFVEESFVDWRGKLVATVFTFGCNFRCPFCHNHSLVVGKPLKLYKEEDILETLESLKGWIDGICITGGEPTIHRDLLDFIKKLRNIAPVKLDTNGTNPSLLEKILPYVDYVAMDIKAPREKYQELAGTNVNMNDIERSIKLIRAKAKDYEFRTTYVPTLSMDDIIKISLWIYGAKRYVLQQFSVDGGTLNPSFSNLKPHSTVYLQTTCEHIKNSFEECIIANV